MGNLNCLEQCRTQKEHSQRLLILQQGEVFKRKKYLLGISSGTEAIHLKLSSDEQTLIWKPHESTKDPTRIDVNDVNLIKTQGTTGISIMSQRGDCLLEVEADSQEIRDAWVTNLQLLCEDSVDLDESSEAVSQNKSFRKMVEDRAKKQAYWKQRTEELEERKREAEERKKKFGNVGMKYTAIAMMNRPATGADKDKP